jgi:hypothetical protein
VAADILAQCQETLTRFPKSGGVYGSGLTVEVLGTGQRGERGGDHVTGDAETLADRLYGMMPNLRITSLLAEVDRWTGFSGAFTHLDTSNNRVLADDLGESGRINTRSGCRRLGLRPFRRVAVVPISTLCVCMRPDAVRWAQFTH